MDRSSSTLVMVPPGTDRCSPTIASVLPQDMEPSAWLEENGWAESSARGGVMWKILQICLSLNCTFVGPVLLTGVGAVALILSV